MTMGANGRMAAVQENPLRGRAETVVDLIVKRENCGSNFCELRGDAD
jgi:hypothetical protein